MNARPSRRFVFLLAPVLVVAGIIVQDLVVDATSARVLDPALVATNQTAATVLSPAEYAAFLARRQLAVNRTLDGSTFNETVGLPRDGHVSVRETLYHALAYVASPDPTRCNATRANRIVTALLEGYLYRDKYRGMRQWGAFSRHYQPVVPLDTDDYDSNWVNFLSPFLGYLLLEHEAALEPATLRVVRRVLPLVASELYALQNRVTYTNIYLLRCAGQMMYARVFNDLFYARVAKHDFAKWRDLVLARGFQEFNSPNYGYIDVWALSCVYIYAVDAEVQATARLLLEWFLLDYGLHYHPVTFAKCGTAGRMGDADRDHGRGSHANVFYQYFGYPDLGSIGGSGTRLLTNREWYPPRVFGEVAINKSLPLVVTAHSYGVDRYTYVAPNYTLATQSGARFPEHAGSTAAGMSGQALKLYATYAANYPRADGEDPRVSCWFDVNPHYNVFNSIQHHGTAVSTVNLDAATDKRDDAYWLAGYLGARAGLSEIRVNNLPWNGTPVALDSADCVCFRVNDTYVALRATPNRVSTIVGDAGVPVTPTRPTVLAWAGDELTWTSYVYRDPGTARLPGTTVYAGLCLELRDQTEVGSFEAFCSACQASSVNATFDAATGTHAITYQSALAGLTLALVENTGTNRLVSRAINGTPTDPPMYLLASPYARIPKPATLADVVAMWNASTLAADFPDLSLAFLTPVGLPPGQTLLDTTCAGTAVALAAVWAVILLGVGLAWWKLPEPLALSDSAARKGTRAALALFASTLALEMVVPWRSGDVVAWYGGLALARLLAGGIALHLPPRPYAHPRPRARLQNPERRLPAWSKALGVGLLAFAYCLAGALLAVMLSAKFVFAFHLLVYAELLVTSFVGLALVVVFYGPVVHARLPRPAWLLSSFLLGVGFLGLGTIPVLTFTRSDIPPVVPYLACSLLVAVQAVILATTTARWPGKREQVKVK